MSSKLGNAGPNTGSDNYGGPLVTAGGVLFIGATNFDRTFRVIACGGGKNGAPSGSAIVAVSLP